MAKMRSYTQQSPARRIVVQINYVPAHERNHMHIRAFQTLSSTLTRSSYVPSNIHAGNSLESSVY